jgi:hypothetical protein
MSEVIHRETVRDYTIEIVYDDNVREPRDGDCYGTLVFFKERGWTGADEYISSATIDPTTGEYASDADSLEGWKMFMYRHWPGAFFVLPIARDSHGPQSRYWPVNWGDGYDGSIVGFLVYTEQHLSDWFGEDSEWPDEDALWESMEGEMREFTDWANGNTWGYRILDVNGDEVESCWGFICDWDTYVLNEARHNVPDEPVERLYTVRLTAAQCARLVTLLVQSTSALSSQSAELIDTLNRALKEATA